MDRYGMNVRVGVEQSCRHPPERIVLGNDRMEPTCLLCGEELPFEAYSQGDAPAAATEQARPSTQ